MARGDCTSTGVAAVLLSDLLAGTRILGSVGDLRRPVARIAYHSGRVARGDLFVAWRGARFDGHDFIGRAWERGAAAVLAERPLRELPPPPSGAAMLQVQDCRAVLGPLSAKLYGYPTSRMGVCGVTGTNGKTTTSWLVREVLGVKGPVGLVGTVSAIVGGEAVPARLTTPEAPDLQALFADMVGRGDRYCVMEVSSMALYKGRVDGTAFDVGVFTNLTQDHIGGAEHPDFNHYRESKRRLFAMLGGASPKDFPRCAVLNADDGHAPFMAGAVPAGVPVVRYGVAGPGARPRPSASRDPTGSGAPPDLLAEDVRLRPDGAEFSVQHPGGRCRCELRLTGRYNVQNALAAFAVGLVHGIEAGRIAEALYGMRGVPGRLERIEGAQPFSVFVDYAHTPDGLRQVLRAAREVAAGRVIAVFGCGGDRDRGKRPVMGRIAAEVADLSWLTSDNPRSEAPEAIIADIAAGARQVRGAHFFTVPDRRQAIGEALAAAGSGDVVVIAGKGHETYQTFAERTVHFDDREEAAEALQRLGFR